MSRENIQKYNLSYHQKKQIQKSGFSPFFIEVIYPFINNEIATTLPLQTSFYSYNGVLP